MNKDEVLRALNPELIESFKRAIELGKWPDGKKLTDEQREVCMQSIILYEHQNVPEHERTGYVPPKTTPCAPDTKDETIKWK